MDVPTLFVKTTREIAASYCFEECETVVDPKGPMWTPDVVAALVRSNGNLGQAASHLQRSRDSLKRWVESKPEVQEALLGIRATLLDEVETTQFDLAIVHKDGAAGRFLLQTLAKDRGFITRVEQTGKDGEPLQPPSVDFTKLSLDTLKELDAARTSED